jgi:hypothetical protein
VGVGFRDRADDFPEIIIGSKDTRRFALNGFDIEMYGIVGNAVRFAQMLLQAGLSPKSKGS